MENASLKIVLVLVAILGVQQSVVARPNHNSRVKRVSDTHLQDLETKLALTKLKGFTMTLPVAAGKDLDRIGRKRRSQARALDVIFNQSEEDNGRSQRINDVLGGFQPINDYQRSKSKRFVRFQPISDGYGVYEPVRERLGQNEPIDGQFYNDYDEDPLNYGLRIKK